MRIERLQEALEGLGLDTEGKRFNLLQRLAEALKGSSGDDPLEHEQVAAKKGDDWILASVVSYDASSNVYEVRDEAEAHERRAAAVLEAADEAVAQHRAKEPVRGRRQRDHVDQVDDRRLKQRLQHRFGVRDDGDDLVGAQRVVRRADGC